MKFEQGGPNYIRSECGRYLVTRAATAPGIIAYYAVRLFRGSTVIGVERDLAVTDEAACADARLKLRRLCAADAIELEKSS